MPERHKGVEIQRSAKTVLSGKSRELQRKRSERESDIGAAPRDQSPEVGHSESQNSPLWKRDLAAENGARKSPGGGSATAIQLSIALRPAPSSHWRRGVSQNVVSFKALFVTIG